MMIGKRRIEEHRLCSLLQSWYVVSEGWLRNKAAVRVHLTGEKEKWVL